MTTQPATEGQTQPAQGQPQAESQNTTVPPVDEVQTRIDASLKPWQDKFEIQKAEIAGLNRAISDKDKKIQEMELSKLSAEDQVKARLDAANAKIAEAETTALELKKTNIVVSKGLDPDFAKLINGKTDDEIKISLETVMSHIDKEVNKRTEKAINDRFGGAAPQGGNPPQNATLQSAYDEAKKKNAMALMTAIKRQASNEGIIIKD
jgi:hypothetical protein